MQALIDTWEAIRAFLELGGTVLVWIAWVILVMWILILERTFFFTFGLNKVIKKALDTWESRPERKSWHAHQIRESIISNVRMEAMQGLSMIQTLVAICPLLGLLGTVTGMITVFQVMAVAGTGNARSMAAGVSMATVPTMAGMVGALSGVFLVTFLTRSARRRVALLADEMTVDH
jgi:biopolymer transport protein ExbB